MSSQSSTEIFTKFLKKHATYSVLDSASFYVEQGHILESNRVQNIVNGIVRDKVGIDYKVTLEIEAEDKISAKCECSTDEEMEDQWCAHAVALAQQAHSLGFFNDPQVEKESLNYSKSGDTAQDFNRILEQAINDKWLMPRKAKKVEVFLDLTSDRLGVQVIFDNKIRKPHIFKSEAIYSSRKLDNLLVNILNEVGYWDEEKNIWYVNSSEEIEKVLSLLKEYKNIFNLYGKDTYKIADDILNAKLILKWQKNSLKANLFWLMPDGSLQEKTNPVFGTNPFWTLVGDTIYQLSPIAGSFNLFFANKEEIIFSFTKCSLIADNLLKIDKLNKHIVIINPDKTPQFKKCSPKPELTLWIDEEPSSYQSVSASFQITAKLNFLYPIVEKNERIIYLYDRKKEEFYKDSLKRLGFVQSRSNESLFTISADAALNLVYKGQDAFLPDFKIIGLDKIRRKVKFSNLTLVVEIDSLSPKLKKSTEFEARISLMQNNANIPLSLLFKDKDSSLKEWIKLDSGSFAKIPTGNLTALKATLGLIDPNYKLSNTIKGRVSIPQALSLSSLTEGNVRVTADNSLQKIKEKLSKFNQISKIKPNSKFQGELRSYQRDGLNWLYFLQSLDLGGILADEMGLGKTVQALALLQYTFAKFRRKKKKFPPALIVAPTSVLRNWQREAKRFVPNLKTLVLHGPDRRNAYLSLSEYDLIITSYTILRIDRYELSSHFFSYVILDEAQNIKNPHTATAKAAKQIQSYWKLALTGTPTENRPLELWSIFDFLMPGYLGGYEFFKDAIEKPILEGGDKTQAAQILHARISPFVLRRTKKEVEKELPDKIESEVYAMMMPSQRDLYQQFLEEIQPKIFEAVATKGLKRSSMSILAALLKLRQICNHPNSLTGLENAEGYESGKFELLKEITTEALDGGRKILIFCQFIQMMKLIREWLSEEGIRHLYLDGSIKDRQSLIDQFNTNNDIKVFVISLKAGGTGLNLTAADTVIIYDPWWNPAVEDQAVDRAHRIGQTKSVNVYRLVTENSIEEKIMKLKEKKAKIVDALIGQGGNSVFNLTKEDLEELFSLSF